MFVLAGGAALRESVTIDEVTHIGSGVSYLQKLDLRFNEEHPPLAKVLAALPLGVRPLVGSAGRKEHAAALSRVGRRDSHEVHRTAVVLRFRGHGVERALAAARRPGSGETAPARHLEGDTPGRPHSLRLLLPAL